MLNVKKIPLSLYIHVPWCVRKCPYCDFNSHTLKKQSKEKQDEEQYIDALIADFQESIKSMLEVQSRSLHSIFIGGGTPSLFKPKSYERLFKAIFQEIDAQENLEITLEANPGTADEQNFKGYRELGINRISLGVQSFNPEKLKKLGRIHSAEQAHNAFYMAQKAEFENINLDLMFGLPNQTLEEALLDLKTAIDLKPQHLSWYQLTLEPNTVFYKQPPKLPHEDSLWAIEVEGKKKIQQYYQQYEISAYSLPNRWCEHNLNYWLFGDYLGIGAGAHGKITHINHGNVEIWRTQKKRQPEDYMNPEKTFIAKQEMVGAHEIPFEFMLNALRLYQPISYALLVNRTHISIDSKTIKTGFKNAQEKGLIILGKDSFEVTELGHQYLNNLQEIFLSEP